MSLHTKTTHNNHYIAKGYYLLQVVSQAWTKSKGVVLPYHGDHYKIKSLHNSNLQYNALLLQYIYCSHITAHYGDRKEKRVNPPCYI